MSCQVHIIAAEVGLVADPCKREPSYECHYYKKRVWSTYDPNTTESELRYLCETCAGDLETILLRDHWTLADVDFFPWTIQCFADVLDWELEAEKKKKSKDSKKAQDIQS